MKRIISALILASFLSACSTHADDVSATYVSPMEYHDYSCHQIRSEMMRVSRKVNEIAGIQDSDADKDTAALTVGLVIFWPALFFMIGHDKERELSQLKGEYDALEEEAIRKNCDVAKEIKAAKKMQKAREAKKQVQQKQASHLNE